MSSIQLPRFLTFIRATTRSSDANLRYSSPGRWHGLVPSPRANARIAQCEPSSPATPPGHGSGTNGSTGEDQGHKPGASTPQSRPNSPRQLGPARTTRNRTRAPQANRTILSMTRLLTSPGRTNPHPTTQHDSAESRRHRATRSKAARDALDVLISSGRRYVRDRSGSTDRGYSLGMERSITYRREL